MTTTSRMEWPWSPSTSRFIRILLLTRPCSPGGLPLPHQPVWWQSAGRLQNHGGPQQTHGAHPGQEVQARRVGASGHHHEARRGGGVHLWRQGEWAASMGRRPGPLLLCVHRRCSSLSTRRSTRWCPSRWGTSVPVRTPWRARGTAAASPRSTPTTPWATRTWTSCRPASSRSSSPSSCWRWAARLHGPSVGARTQTVTRERWRNMINKINKINNFHHQQAHYVCGGQKKVNPKTPESCRSYEPRQTLKNTEWNKYPTN